MRLDSAEIVGELAFELDQQAFTLGAERLDRGFGVLGDLTRFDGHPSSGFAPEGCPTMESMGRKKPRPRRSFTPEFKAEIVELCQRGDRSVGQVARDFDLTETAVREWVRQAERDAGTRADGGLTSAERRGAGRAATGEPQAARGRGDLEAGDGFLRQGDPMNVYPFIEAEKAGRRNVSRACALLKVSRAAFYQDLAGPSPRDRSRRRAHRADPGRARGVQGQLRGPADARRAAPTRAPYGRKRSPG